MDKPLINLPFTVTPMKKMFKNVEFKLKVEYAIMIPQHYLDDI
jgi:hypothetical protein